MGDTDDIQDKGTDDQKEEKNQTVTIEQFDEMKKIQSGLDRTITELQKQLKQKDDVAVAKEKAAADKEKSEQQKAADRLAAVENELVLTREEKTYVLNKSLALQLLNDKGIKVPRSIDRYVGATEEETIEFVNAFIEDWQEDHADSKDREAKSKGRTVTKTNLTIKDGMSYADMQALSASEFAKIPPEVVKKAMETALKQE